MSVTTSATLATGLLTHDIPAGLGWLIGPFITNIPKETLEFTLSALRKAVLSNHH